MLQASPSNLSHPWLGEVFSAKAVQRGGVVRRAVMDVCAKLALTALLARPGVAAVTLSKAADSSSSFATPARSASFAKDAGTSPRIFDENSWACACACAYSAARALGLFGCVVQLA
jgi:hypothetical protein